MITSLIIIGKSRYLLSIIFVLVAAILGINVTQKSRAEVPFITIASTSSTQNSGFFDYILPFFEKETGIKARVLAVGTGQALRIAENGDADVLLVHHKTSEQEFVKKGFGVKRFNLMYNKFLLVGPQQNEAKVGESDTILTAFAKIAGTKKIFVSRADDSGTHKKEIGLWRMAGFSSKIFSSDWYREVGSGMGATLNIAAAIEGYTITDSGTWLNFNNRANLIVLLKDDPLLFNQYGVILVSPAKHAHVKSELGQNFIQWILSPVGQKLINEFKINGESAFFAKSLQ